MYSLDCETTCGSEPLTTLCQKIVYAHAEHWPPGEAAIAEEFASVYELQALPSTEDLLQLCLRLGIEMSVVPLPESLRGHNCAFGNRRNIVIAEEQSVVGATEHTLLHEMREMLEYTFADLGFPTAKEEELEHRAEKFAQLVRMAAIQRDLIGFLENLSEITSTWWAIAASVLIGAGALVCSLGCALLPQLERLADAQPCSHLGYARNVLR